MLGGTKSKCGHSSERYLMGSDGAQRESGKRQTKNWKCNTQSAGVSTRVGSLVS